MYLKLKTYSLYFHSALEACNTKNKSIGPFIGKKEIDLSHNY